MTSQSNILQPAFNILIKEEPSDLEGNDTSSEYIDLDTFQLNTKYELMDNINFPKREIEETFVTFPQKLNDNVDNPSLIEVCVKNEVKEPILQRESLKSCLDILIREENVGQNIYEPNLELMENDVLKCEVEESIICNLGSNLSHSLIESPRWNHKLHKCLLCLEAFINKKDFEEHKCVYFERQEFNKSFITKQSLGIHQASQHMVTRPYKYPACDESFTWKLHLQRHQEEVHNEVKQYKCSDCEKSFSKKSNLKQHQTTQHLKSKPYQCPECDKCFVQRVNLKQHQHSVHSDFMTYSCPECENSFAKMHHLKLHRMSQHSRDKPFKCTDCDKSFTQLKVLERHQAVIHCGVKPYKCTDCNRTFLRKDRFNEHYLFQHLNVKPYNCPDCEKCFTQKPKLRSHQIKIHQQKAS